MDTTERIEFVVRTAARLTPEDREAVARRIMEETPVGKADARFAFLLGVAEDVTGHTMTRSRDFRNVQIRRMVACRMREEGFHVSDIARAMGMHHASVVHYCAQMRDALDEPIFYANDLRQYARFKDAVEEADRDVE